MITTIQSPDPIVVLHEDRYMQLLRAEDTVDTIAKDSEQFIRQFVKAFIMLNTEKENRPTLEDVIKMEMPDFQILDFPHYSKDNPRGGQWNSGDIKWIKKTK